MIGCLTDTKKTTTCVVAKPLVYFKEVGLWRRDSNMHIKLCEENMNFLNMLPRPAAVCKLMAKIKLCNNQLFESFGEVQNFRKFL